VSIVDVNQHRLAPGETIVATTLRWPELVRARMPVSPFAVGWRVRLRPAGSALQALHRRDLE
jgi:hypothetical protein